MRLIDADALKEEAIKAQNREDTNSYINMGLARAVELIDNAPTIKERPKGEWLPKGRWHIDPQCIEYTCSICGRRIMREERLNVIEQYPFCHCGADMRGDV